NRIGTARGGGRGGPVGSRVVDRRRPPRVRNHSGVARDPDRWHGDPPVETGRSGHAPRPAAAPPSHTRVPRGRTCRGRLAHGGPRHRQGSHGLTNAGQPIPRGRATQPERTTMAWTRTSLAVLANGALLLLREIHGDAGALQLVAVGVAAALAL